MVVQRNAEAHLRKLASWYPVVTVTGPRQSGKTTLCRTLFPEKAYRSFEQADVREFARTDPRGFLDEVRAGAILDEVQHAPELLGYLQVEVDERPDLGRFVLTGSQHLGLTQAVSQSLAGRSGMLTLLPLSADEVDRFSDPPESLWERVWTGGYPRILDTKIPARRWLDDYVFNYVQRDVRQLRNIGDLEAFTTFVRLAAGRTAQPINLSALGADAGVTVPTARAWLSVLEASYVCLRLPAWHRTVRRQMTRAAKLHFYDTGLACALLGIGSPQELRHHPLRGAIFETWVTSEVLKARFNVGENASLFHYRDARRLEVDLISEREGQIDLLEVKSGATIAGDWSTALTRLAARVESTLPEKHVRRLIVYGGAESSTRGGVTHIPWRAVAETDWV